MLSLRIQCCSILFAMGVMCLPAHAEGDRERCISRQHQPTGVGLSREPAAVHGLETLVSRQSEGYVTLYGTDWPSPVGDLTFLAGPYDPLSQRLYLWGFDKNGWIATNFRESGVIEPRLYRPADDIEDVTEIQRSEILGVQFYSGYTAPHWLTGNQSYRVYQISGPEMRRVPELEAGMVDYVGDDLATGYAVFAPAEASWTRSPEMLVWYDGDRIVLPPVNLPSVMALCR